MKLMDLKSDYHRMLEKNPEKKRKITAISKLQWIETSYDFDTAYDREGDPITASEIQRIVQGEYVESRTVQDHIMVRHYYDMVKYIYGILPLKDKADLGLMEKINGILVMDDVQGESAECYRKITPIVKEFSMVPPHHQVVKEELERVLRSYHVLHDQLNPVLRGCFIHNEFLRVYPFSENNEATARALLNFELLAGGLLPLAFGMDKAEYRGAVSMHINHKDPQPFYELILEAEKNRYRGFLEME